MKIPNFFELSTLFMAFFEIGIKKNVHIGVA